MNYYLSRTSKRSLLSLVSVSLGKFWVFFPCLVVSTISILNQCIFFFIKYLLSKNHVQGTVLSGGDTNKMPPFRIHMTEKHRKVITTNYFLSALEAYKQRLRKLTLSHKWFLKTSRGKPSLPAGQSLPENPKVAQWKRISLPMQETQETQVQSRGPEDPLEEEMATHPGILAWRIPWTDSHAGLADYSPWGCKRVRHG